MKKLLPVSLLFLLISTTAHAQYRESESLLQHLLWDDEMLNILLDMRFDGEFSTGNDDGKNLGFHAHTFKIWVAGEIIPGIRYRLRHRLTKDQSPQKDGLSAATDHAWLAFDIGKNKQWTITAGKQSIQFGTYEYDYGSADVYLSTMINKDLDSYKIGVNTVYRFNKQAINLQIINSDSPQFASEKYRNKSLGAALLWEGNLWKGKIKTRWGYSTFMHTDSKLYNWITTGTQVNVLPFVAELDYFIGSRNIDYNYVFAPGFRETVGIQYVRDQSASINLKLDMGKWKPAIKGIWDQRYDKEIGRQAYRNFGIQGLLEFYPFTNKYVKDLRFHIAYFYKQTEFMGNFASMDNKNAHTLLAGVRWMFKAK